MGSSTSRVPLAGNPPSMGIKRPGIDDGGSRGVDKPGQEVRPGATRPGVKFGPGQSTRFD